MIKKIEQNFLIAEYEQVILTYWKGVDMGVTWVRSLIVINSLLLALFGSLGQYLKKSDNLSVVLITIAILGIILAIGLMSFIPYWGKQLKMAAARAEEIESIFGGRLFTQANINAKSRIISPTTGMGASILCISFIFMWTLMIFIGNDIEFMTK